MDKQLRNIGIAIVVLGVVAVALMLIIPRLEPSNEVVIEGEALLATIADDHEDIRRLMFSETGASVAYTATRGEEELVVFNGEEQPGFTEVRGLIVSPDGTEFAYRGRTGDTWQVVLNGEVGRSYDVVWRPRFSALGDLGYIAQRDGKWFMVIDTEEIDERETINLFEFSPDGRNLAYTAKENGEWFFAMNNSDLPRTYEAVLGRPIFSGDSGEIAFRASLFTEWFVEYRGIESARYIEVQDPVLSHDGDHIAFAARDAEGWFVVRDGVASGERFDEVIQLVINRDGSDIAYLAQREGQWLVVRDEIGNGPFELVQSVAFSPDGSHLAAVVRNAGQWAVSIDSERGDLRFSEAYNAVYDDAGDNYAFRGQRSGDWFIVINDTEHSVEGRVEAVKMQADGTTVGYGTRIDNELWWRILSVE